MTIDVTGPGGISVSFPDGTDAATIDGVMAHAAGPGYDSPEFNKAIAEKYGARPEDVAQLKSGIGQSEALRGIPIAGGFLDKLGGYLAAASTGAGVLGGASGADFSERAAKNTAMQREIAAAFQAAHPIQSGAAQFIGGATALGGLGSTALGARALGVTGGGLPSQIGWGALSGAGIGGTDAAIRAGMNGGDAATGGVTGAAIGGGLGGAFPAAGRLLGAVASPIVSNLMARTNPAGAARDQIARGIIESGRAPADIAAEVAQAAGEGQGQYTLADALGLAGQRMLSGVARQPGEARTLVADTLEARQAGQGRRIAGQLAEGFQAPRTAADLEQAMRASRDADADVNYAAARANAGPVDVTPVIRNIDATLTPGANQIARPQSGLASDSIERALEGVRSRLTDNRSNLTDFTALQRVRGDLADQVQQAVQRGQGNRARLLGGVLRSLDSSMEAASPGFRQANATFAQVSRDMEAVGAGRTAAQRGRTEDIIPQFQGLSPEGQQAFRTGYVDPLIQQAQGAAFGVNKARPLTSDAFQAESRAMAPNADLLARQLGRENTMFETRNQALGGSMTAQNLADNAALGSAASLATNLLTGNHGGLGRQALTFIGNALTGSTPEVRRQVAMMLLQRGGNVSAQDLAQTIQAAVNTVTRREHNLRLMTAVTARALQPQTEDRKPALSYSRPFL